MKNAPITGPFHGPVDPEHAVSEAVRCYGCSETPCAKGGLGGCSLLNPIRDVHAALTSGDAVNAVRFWLENSPFPAIFGEACEALCINACSPVMAGMPAIDIPGVEGYIHHLALEKGMYSPLRPEANGINVAIFGAGIAGLYAAWFLRKQGFGVTVFEAKDRAGGLCIDGIPPEHLSKDAVSFYQDLLERSGVQFRFSCRVGEDVEVQAVDGDYRIGDQIFAGVVVAIGARKARQLELLDGSALQLQPLDLLGDAIAQTQGWGTHVDRRVGSGKKVIVLGGGLTARDCAWMALHHLSAEVEVWVRKGHPGDETPIWRLGRDSRHEIVRLYDTTNVSVHFGEELEGIDGTSVLAKSGRRIENVSCMIPALGLAGPGFLPWMEALGIGIDDDGFAKPSTRPNVICAGDLANGRVQTLVDAAASGKNAGLTLATNLRAH